MQFMHVSTILYEKMLICYNSTAFIIAELNRCVLNIVN